MNNREFTLKGTLTSKMLEDMDFRTVFARGEFELNGLKKKWIAITDMITNWAIFWGEPTEWDEQVWRGGRKLAKSVQIRKLVPCTDEALDKYK